MRNNTGSRIFVIFFFSPALTDDTAAIVHANVPYNTHITTVSVVIIFFIFPGSHMLSLPFFFVPLRDNRILTSSATLSHVKESADAIIALTNANGTK